MHPELFHLGPILIRSYSVMLELGIGLGLVVAYLEARRLGFSLERFIDLTLVLLISGIIGARLYFAAVNWSLFESDLLGIFRVWDGGLVLHGAILGGLIGGAIYLKRHNISFWWVADIGMPSALLAQAVGRLGCLLNGCCYGEPTTLPWGISFPLAVDDIPRHPTQLYEFGGDLIVFAILWSVRKRKPFDGFVFALYLILYSLVRVIVEFWRADPAEVFGELRFAQAMSLGLVAVGFAVMGYLSWRASRGTQPAPVPLAESGSSAKEEV